MSEEPSEIEFEERTMRDLAGLADGSLEGRRRAALEQQVESSPELAAALDRQRFAVSALCSLDVQAPLDLRARIASEVGRAPRRRSRLPFAAGLLAACAAVALLVVLLLPSSGSEPSVVATARLSELPATRASVPVDPENPKLLAVSSAGVPFPNFEDQFGWDEAGDRSDELDGRSSRTVFYERGGHRIGYTITAGNPIEPPPGSQRTTVDGVVFSTASDGGQEIVTWLREGRTCVLAGRGVSRTELVELAAWTGKGSIPF